jgi:hypothetical protein
MSPALFKLFQPLDVGVFQMSWQLVGGGGGDGGDDGDDSDDSDDDSDDDSTTTSELTTLIMGVNQVD